MVILELKKTMDSLIEVISQLSDQEYSQAIVALEENTIGFHARHIYEFILCLTEQYETGLINYDLRRRDKRLESSVGFLITSWDQLRQSLSLPDKMLHLKSKFYIADEIVCDTTYFREIGYNLEHCIHHQALIKIGLRELARNIQVKADFGIAPSTLRARLT